VSKVRVLVVDDSALMRQLLTEILSSDRELEVIATAADGASALRKRAELSVDVMTLDVDMPGLNGLDLLAQLMATQPLPVVMVSSLTQAGQETTLRALELGAVDFVGKPVLDIKTGTLKLADELIAKVKAAARARPRARLAGPPPSSPSVALPKPTLRPAEAADPALLGAAGRLIAIGTSTGGTEALRTIITRLPPDAPPTVAVIHMPAGFTRAFAARLDRLSHVHVREAAAGTVLQPGLVLIAPGDRHMRLRHSHGQLVVELGSDPPVAHHRPSVDVLFQSVAAELGERAVGAILTGMGADGAEGMKAMHERGAYTVAQDEATCVVFGMPREAIALGAASEVLPLPKIAAALVRAARSARAAPPR
jgi:two-component system chemotaxis response regulator CheB